MDFSNLSEFDVVAQSISAKLGCTASLISVTRGDILFALGHSGATSGRINRSNLARDTICDRTVRAEKPLQINSIEADAVLRDIPAVRALGIGAYMGVPIKMQQSGATVGAICALSSSARIWRDSEMAYLAGVTELVESKIERHVLYYEQQALSEALAENDAILSVLAQVQGKAMTIHNAQGDLVYASSAMHGELKLSDRDMLALPDVTRELRRRNEWSGVVKVMLPPPTCTELKVQMSQVGQGLILAEWACGKRG